jgi:hypothetical protein
MTPKWLTKITNQGTRNSPLPLALRFTHKYANALSLLPLQGEGWDGDGFLSCAIETHPHPNPPPRRAPLKGEGTSELSIFFL